ncbi:MAG TPA: DUF1553 domain-containing protein [Isosphaeraceae bacterium]|nr:DUF1553 domain-containing protein [Isosphaeraceae bacterium]
MRQTVAIMLIALSGWGVARAADPIDYDRDIRPILGKHCVTCHGAGKQKSGLRLDGLSFLHRGGDRGPAITPGAASESVLVQAISGDGSDVPMMPPKGDRLSAEEVSLIRAWVEQGAHGTVEKTTNQPAERASDHWAFRPVVRPPVPAVQSVSWVRNPIDRFVLARLERQGIRPAPAADRTTLLRRLTLDLTGLPPTIAEVESFLADDRPDAYEHCVERLLASPSYGERWGRHWLDAACYADSGGYESDYPRSLWKYREWVIKALNRDLPFDQFAIEQFAGDLLPNSGGAEQVATGFLCTAMYDGTLGQGENARLKMTIDRVNMVGTVFLGLTLGCAQCHSHKFDPISQREYYQFFAFLNNLESAREQTEADRSDALRAQVKALEQELTAYEQAAGRRQERWEANLDAASRAKLAPEFRAALAVPSQRRSQLQKDQIRAAFLEQDPGHRQRLAKIRSLREQESRIAQTPVARELATPRTTHVFRRGEFSDPGEVVAPDVPAVLPRLKATAGRPSRLDLARWLVAPENPLTARVIVNRVWQHDFGTGLVATEDNFGLSGEPPSHPELLDWLASEFIATGWSLKALQRLIVGSSVYRQSSRVRPELAEIDPANRLLARQRRLRLEAEVIRDGALAVSGLLARKLGGPSVFPYQPPGILLGRATKADWVVSPGADRYRRGMYTYFWRLTPYPLLRLFDAPDTTTACTRRIRTNTPLQALSLLNDPTFTECAQALAERLRRESPGSDRDRVRHAFRLCLGREPSPEELRKVESYLAEMPTAEPNRSGSSATEWVGLARALLNLDEFITRE